jgi:CheY-like chemotaxis protein
MRVLIADDQKAVGKSLAELVSFCNHQIVGVLGSGLEAIQAYTQHHPDLVLMDYRMPKLNGTTALRNILSKDPAARVILVTGWSLADEASASGAIAILLKPIDLERLNATLQAVAQTLPVPAHAEPPTPKVSSQPIRSITASPLLSPCQSTRLLWKRLFLSTQQPVISNKPGKWVRWTRKRFLASVAAVSAALNGVSGMSDMTGKAARVRGRAQLELLRYHAPAFIERNHFLRRVTRFSRWRLPRAPLRSSHRRHRCRRDVRSRSSQDQSIRVPPRSEYVSAPRSHRHTNRRWPALPLLLDSASCKSRQW